MTNLIYKYIQLHSIRLALALALALLDLDNKHINVDIIQLL